ncbi:NifU family protein [Anaerofustis butyriciformans]|uniref:NifU family protein n=1 Tax=Anaerofustis butyriciformans TaxID=3108533 RepID=UPI002E320EDA|nr:NifU family protein [Anaerofustis sp. HA2171]
MLKDDKIIEIEKVLNDKVRPYLKNHGGNVVIKEYKEGILKVKLIGQCANCVSAKTTNEELIKYNLLKEIPSIKDVILVEGVNDELLDFAKNFLKEK